MPTANRPAVRPVFDRQYGSAFAPFSHPSTGRRRFAGFAKTACALAAVLVWQVASAQPLKAGPVLSPVQAQGPAADPTKNQLTTQLVVSRVVQLAGAESLAAATTVQPGDVLHYTATFSNPTANALRDVVASMPVPAGTQWLPSSAQPAAVRVSTDGQTFAAMPLMRKKQLPNGQWVDVAVPISEIRFLRWPAHTLAAGERLATSLRVRVDARTEPVATALSSPLAGPLFSALPIAPSAANNAPLIAAR